ncbi:hypothetical protein LAZ67_16000650 [Cordylochernes scorpioides]|uniref:ATP-dependent DNA helicase n=1 Tax=Cordylochernes scorpioides TaxID=51811 RepID=A0ABY6LDF3_9ARAC|nr:hypothetical protein LAZ67_16000650 [Cordylochernes scorpioides]
MPPKRKSIGRSTSQGRSKKISRASESVQQRDARLEADRIQTAKLARMRQFNNEKQGWKIIEYKLLRVARMRQFNNEKQGWKIIDYKLFKLARMRQFNNEKQGWKIIEYKLLKLARMRQFNNEKQGWKIIDYKLLRVARMRQFNNEKQGWKIIDYKLLRVARMRQFNNKKQGWKIIDYKLLKVARMRQFNNEKQDHNFLQIYFMGNTDDQVNQRCKFNSSTNQEIVSILQNLLDQHNELVRLFKTAIERMPTDDYVVVIRADKTPAGQHERRFNAPTIDEVAILIVGEEFNSRDIVIHRRDDNVQRVSETHRSYDALQYPILFWQGEDGYHFNIKMRDPKTAIHCRYVCKNRDRTTTFHSIEPNQLRALMHFIVKYRVFGASQCWMYSIEWKKRGLPHAHILIWLIDKITPDQIDQVISAEIPDIAIDPDLFEVVAKNMIHGPCGAINNNSPCMKDGKCTKRYPRDLHAETITGVDGYPQYRRRSTQDGGKCITIKVHNIDIEVDNRWIVPYLPLLSRTFKAHINVEYCNSVKSIKYICKYVNKGSDMAVFGVKNESAPIDEVQRYQLERTSVAIRQFGVFYHFQFMNVILQLFIWQYISKMGSECILQRKICSELLHLECIRKKFQRRKQGKPVEGHPNIYSSDALGRLYTFHPSNQECLYLRLLLVNVCGPESFQELRTVNGKACSTYREACQELYLLENDAHWDTTLADASSTAQPHQIRMLFAILLTTCFPSKPIDLWEKYKDSMSEDILHHLRAANLDLQFTPEIYNRALVLIEDICLAIANKRLGQMGLCAPNRSANDSYDRDLQRETHFDVDDLSVFVERNLSKLVPEQRIAYDTLMQAISDQRGGLYFLDAPGGTGKPFLINLILATIRSRNEIAVAIASYGIAATLLDGGRTAHSALKLPLNLHTIETPTCNISKNSGMGKVLQTCKLIIWDECTMAHKKGLEALDRTLKDLRANGNSFGGALILLSGDFRQTLPVIPRSTPADELNACLNNLFYGLRSRDVRTSVVLISWRNDLELDSGPPTAAKWIKWKTGVPIILLRNINPLKLCNGTRLSVKTMMNNIIEATILNGKFKGQDLLLPRIPLLPPDLPLEFKRLQFPVRTAFSMTINKAQGKSLKVCGLNLEAPCFSHGQLYVASSRVPSNLYVYTPDKTGKTKNVVYLKALD